MTARQRRAVAAVVAAIPVGGLTCGMTPSWSVNLASGVAKGALVGVAVFAALSLAHRAIAGRP